jgi:hypothetical protein
MCGRGSKGAGHRPELLRPIIESELTVGHRTGQGMRATGGTGRNTLYDERDTQMGLGTGIR